LKYVIPKELLIVRGMYTSTSKVKQKKYVLSKRGRATNKELFGLYSRKQNNNLSAEGKKTH